MHSNSCAPFKVEEMARNLSGEFASREGVTVGLFESPKIKLDRQAPNTQGMIMKTFLLVVVLAGFVFGTTFCDDARLVRTRYRLIEALGIGG